MGLFGNYNMQGFGPADEVPSTDSGQALLFRQKDPKPFPAVRSPPAPARGGKVFGCLRLRTESFDSAQDRSYGYVTRRIYSEPCQRAQTALVKEVDSVLRLRCAERGLR